MNNKIQTIIKYPLLISAIVYSTVNYADTVTDEIVESVAPIGLSVKAGTLGLGLELDYSFNENWNARIQANSYTYDDDFEEDGIDYVGEIDLSTTGLLIDWRPFSGVFRMSAGYYLNDNKLSGFASDQTGTEVYEIGDSEYYSNPSNPLSLNTEVKLGSGSAGYLGLGWGNSSSIDGGFMFSFEIGVLISGEPTVELEASGSVITSSPEFGNQTFTVGDNSTQLSQNLNNELDVNLQNERANLEEDISDFKLYPVISIGVGYRF